MRSCMQVKTSVFTLDARIEGAIPSVTLRSSQRDDASSLDVLPRRHWSVRVVALGFDDTGDNGDCRLSHSGFSLARLFITS